MKDQLTAVLEAVRLVQGDLADYLRNGETNPRATLARIMERLASPSFVEATNLFGIDAPSIAPSLDEMKRGSPTGRTW
jgi:hypothetical protein